MGMIVCVGLASGLTSCAREARLLFFFGIGRISRRWIKGCRFSGPDPNRVMEIAPAPAPKLVTQLSMDLMRGVPLHVALSGWAKHWVSLNGMFNLSPSSYQLSRRSLIPTGHYGVFRACVVLSYLFRKLPIALSRLHRPVESLENFLSHDWATSRWLKLLSLLIIFNSKPAAVATFLAGFGAFWGQFGRLCVLATPMAFQSLK